MALPDITWDSKGRPWRVVDEARTTYYTKLPDAKGKLVLTEISYMCAGVEALPKGWNWQMEDEIQAQKALRINEKETKDA